MTTKLQCAEIRELDASEIENVAGGYTPDEVPGLKTLGAAFLVGTVVSPLAGAAVGAYGWYQLLKAWD
jgi:hypothetical protein